jgi:hypothetical protein
MAIKKFETAVSTISGSSFPNFREMTRDVKIDAAYRSRYVKSMLVSLVSEPFRWVENWKYGEVVKNTQITKDPVFILGHWRSGTTYLHNLLSQDLEMAYVTTYQSVFPNQLLSSRWLFRSLMSAKMPKRRPADNVELNADYPQEEEFALGDMNPYSLYNFWYFPKHTQEYFDKFIKLKGFSKAEQQRWKNDYELFVKKTLVNQATSSRFLSKNPPHTGRVPQLLELFPNAKFIYIYRNPISVFLSTFNFFTKTIPPLKFQDITDLEMEDNILYVYEQMLRKYESDKAMIPAGNLIELKYEDFEHEPLVNLEHIYQQLNLPNFNITKDRFVKYIDSQNKFKVNKHQISDEKIEKIYRHLGFAMEQYQYSVPDDIEILATKGVTS